MKFRSPEKFKNAHEGAFLTLSTAVNFEHDHDGAISRQTCHQRGYISALVVQQLCLLLQSMILLHLLVLLHVRFCERAC